MPIKNISFANLILIADNIESIVCDPPSELQMPSELHTELWININMISGKSHGILCVSEENRKKIIRRILSYLQK